MLLAIRIFGKNELSQLNPGDVVLLLLISNAVQNAMVGTNTSLAGGLVAALVLFLANYVVKHYFVRNPLLKEYISSHPDILIRNGKVYSKTLLKVDIDSEELLETVREHGIENFSGVKLAILEEDGNISVISKDGKETTHIRKRKKGLAKKVV